MENEDIFNDLSKTNNFFQQIETEKQLAHLELLKLTRSRMKKSNLLDSVNEKALEILNERLNPEDPEDLNNLSINSLVNVIEKFSRIQTELLAGILGATRSNVAQKDQQSFNNSNQSMIDVTPKIEGVSKEDFKASKNILNFIKKINELSSEFPEIEGEINKADEESNSNQV